MKQLKYSAILELRNREVALNFSGNVELLRSILKAAFPIQRLEAAGVSDFYAAVGNGEWTYWSISNPLGKPDINIPIKPMDYFFEHSGIETASRIAENSTFGKVTYDVSDLIMEYTTQSGQAVFLSAQDIECISQFKPKIKEVCNGFVLVRKIHGQ